MSQKNIFQNRELTWLAFNERVLEEAEEKENPLLERLKFLAIFSSNLDEFFMIRVAGLKDQLNAGYQSPDIAGLTPFDQLNAISDRSHQLVKRQYQEWSKVQKLLGEKSICFSKISEISDPLKKKVEEVFEKQIFPALTPMGIDPTHPFPFLHTQTLNMLYQLKKNGDPEKYAIVPVPSILPRYTLVHYQSKTYVFFIEDLIQYFGAILFPGFDTLRAECFRLTRNADLAVDEDEGDDLLMVIEDKLRERKKGAVVRLEVSHTMPEDYLSKLMDILEIETDDVYSIPRQLDLTFCMDLSFELAEKCPEEVHPSFTPHYIKEKNIFDTLKQKNILLHHPFDSFQTVVDFLTQAAEDPNVLAIKQTLYRSSGQDSAVIKQLIKAVENNKQVTVLVELKARFDEAKNIEWAKKLEEIGCHVIYGVSGLKTHSKSLLIIRREDDGEIKRYMHLGTGNYNEKTARLYTDISFLTADEDLAQDTASFFNYLTGYAIEPDWRKLTISPKNIREKILDLIDNEISKHTTKSPGRVVAKMNSLVDKAIIEKLYQASRAGVKIDLIIRGICCLKAGVKGLSENIRVISIVGRFLEHSRIVYFKNAGSELFYISSADWMPRNLDRRIELLVPVEDKASRKKIWAILERNLKDNVKARELKETVYKHVKRKGERFSSQEEFLE